MSKQQQKHAKPEQKARPQPDAPKADDVLARPMTDDQQRNIEYVQALMSGRAQPATRFEKDVLNQLRQAEQELSGLRGRIEQLTTALENAKTRRIALTAISQQLGLNLVTWRDPKVVVPRPAKPNGN